MDKSFNDFAGWLRFFQIWVMLNLLFGVFTGVILFETLFKESDKLLSLGDIARFGFVIYLLYDIVKHVQYPRPDIPEKINDNLFYIFAISGIHFLYFTAVSMLVYNRDWNMMNTINFAGAVQTMLWTTIWRTYFERSKRVDNYYNQNIDITV